MERGEYRQGGEAKLIETALSAYIPMLIPGAVVKVECAKISDVTNVKTITERNGVRSEWNQAFEDYKPTDGAVFTLKNLRFMAELVQDVFEFDEAKYVRS